MKNKEKNRKDKGRDKARVAMCIIVIAVVFFIAASAHAVVLESGIPGVGEGGRQGAKLPGLATYINYLYIFVLSFVGIAGFISLVIWGTVWVGSAVVDKKARALEGIKNTLIGIGIALTAFIMLNTINPDLTRIKIPGIGPVNIPATKTNVVKLKAIGEACDDSSQCASANCQAPVPPAKTPTCQTNPNSAAAAAFSVPDGSVPDGGICYNDAKCSFPGSYCAGKKQQNDTGVCALQTFGSAGVCGDTSTALACEDRAPGCKWCSMPMSGPPPRCVLNTLPCSYTP